MTSLRKHHPSIERYIRSIGRYFVIAVATMTLLIVATYKTVSIALDRHSLQQDISYLLGRQFIRFQQLSSQTRAIMRASADPSTPDYVVNPMVDNIRESISDMRAMNAKLDELHEKIAGNLLEKLNPRDEVMENLRSEFDARLEDFLSRAERVVEATREDRRQRYSFWGPIDFAVASDSLLMRQFSALIEGAHDRSEGSISHARLISTLLLSLNAAALILATMLLFLPLLRKLHNEHRRTLDFEVKLTHLAHSDALTGLNNRSSFNDALTGLFDDLERTGRGFAMLLVDLDHFKDINDSLGHPAGDAVLKQVANVLRKTFRPDDIVARLGGDEFAVLLPEIDDATTLEAIAHCAVAAIADEYRFEGRLLPVSASIGGAVVPQHANDEGMLAQLADLALYAAKGKRNTATIFDERSHAQRLQENQLALALAAAIDRNEFVVHYQRKIELQTGLHLGFEALVRWQHPELGILPPARFLPLIKRNNLMCGMTRCVINAVASDLKGWKARGLRPGSIAINLPEALLIGEDGYNLVANAIDTNRLEWADLAVEVTEDVFLNRGADQIRETIARFRDHGMSVSLDDFGTGFASLVHLRDFPFDELKIDRSFVTDLGNDIRSEQIVRAMIDLAHSLGKRCVAEGIENDIQRDFLLAANCDIGQGYLFAKPEPAAIAAKRLISIASTQPAIQPSLQQAAG
ncbi:EAL domain-containing protein [Agrobacterium leguminum]|uniref:putative bifunctional diguanylate cyclase/phosphodiesterase n=1 Tax=Agrobacterium leguminum TaxID=2792015 RepID=UPI0022B83BB9|nr:EAL domain-containing protein [Agrobacterium leguminum]MCZ7933030.1 EAL domain-containing protein [Agrobacterium leguminum]